MIEETNSREQNEEANGQVITDMNELALEEFRNMVENDNSLDPEWKQTTLDMIEQGIPADIKSLEILVEQKGLNNAEAEEITG